MIPMSLRTAVTSTTVVSPEMLSSVVMFRARGFGAADTICSAQALPSAAPDVLAGGEGFLVGNSSIAEEYVDDYAQPLRKTKNIRDKGILTITTP